MATNNFIPELWASGILSYNKKNLVYGFVANTEYEGQIKNQGDTVHYAMVLPPTVSAYVKNSTSLTYPALMDSAGVIKITESNSVSWSIDSVDKVQQNPKLMDEALRLSSWALKNDADAFFLGLYGQAGNTVTDASVDTATIISDIALAAQYLDEANVPDGTGNRFLIVPSWVYQKIFLARLIRDTSNSAIMSSAYVGDFGGFSVFKSNNVYTTGTAPNYTSYCLAGWTGNSIAMAEQLVEFEALKHPTAFGDAVRALHLYGAKVVRPDCLVNLAFTYAAESAI